MQVIVYNNDIESAIKRLKKAVINEGILKDFMRKTAYEKPSEQKRRRRGESIARSRADEKQKRRRLGF